MILNDMDSITELFKYIPYYMLVALPIFIIVSPANPVAAAHEFSVSRMHQYDLHNIPHGCRSSLINLEGRSLSSWRTSRHCVVVKMTDLTIDHFLEIKSKAGALLIVTPMDIAALTQEQIQQIKYLENAMNQQEINIPVYFLPWTEEIDDILTELEDSVITDEKSETALEAIFNSVSANGFQIVTTATAPAKIETKIQSFSGKLWGSSSVSKAITITAQLDANGIAPDLAYGPDAASGAVILIELARIFSQMYATHRPESSLVFALLGAGSQYNFFSLKKWLDHQLDTADSTFQQSHKDVSRGTILDVQKSDTFANILKNTQTLATALSAHLYNGTGIDHHNIPKVNSKSMEYWYDYFTSQPRALHIIAAPPKLGVYGPAVVTPITNRLILKSKNLMTYHALRSSYQNQNNKYDMYTEIEKVLRKYLGEVVTFDQTVDKKEPELVLYNPTKATMNLYSVKPAVFDLIITLFVAAYLGLFYLGIVYFPKMFSLFVKSKDKVY